MNGILTRTVARLLLLPILVMAVAILVRGYVNTGDGFSAGVIAATGIILQFIACGHRNVIQKLGLSGLAPIAFVGVLITFLVAFVPVLFGEPLVSHFPSPAAEVKHLGTLELHTAVLFDVGVFFLILGFSIVASHIIASEADARPVGEHG
ncbi:MAG: sodium:proton antiporter [Oscillochloris sp.]|nr:sodium:proton antiporter [Oscillochloris sp.]